MWTVEQLNSLTPAEIAALHRTDFALFVQAMYRANKPGEPLVWAPFLDLICAKLGEVAHGRLRHLIITVPPRSLKSFCVSVCLPAFVHAHYPEQEIMCVSYGQDLARELASDCMRVMRSKAYIDLFGPVLKPERQSPNRLETTESGVRRATSIDGVATGVGGHLIIFDDPQKPGETMSDVIRRATNSQYENTFLARRNLASEARMVIVMQRLHEDDFVGHVLELAGDDITVGGGAWDTLNLPAIAEENQTYHYEDTFGRRIFQRRIGDPLNPKRVSLDELKSIRRNSGEAVWASQYQQRPAPDGGGIVKIDWFKRFAEADKPAKFDRVLQSWDTAFTSNKASDYSCCTTWGLKGKDAYLLHVHRARLEFHELRKAVVEQAELHEASEVLVEDKGSGISLIQDLRNSGFGRVRPVKIKDDKQTRMLNQTVVIENGFVHLPKEAPWLAEYIHELSVFPNGRHDDQVDSTSQALESIATWGQGRGLLEFYRQENEARTPEKSEIWILQPPPAMGMFQDEFGVEHYQQPDGTIHLPRPAAMAALSRMGWTRLA